MQKYMHSVCKIEGFFLGITTKPILRLENSKANELVKVIAQGTTLPSDVFYEFINEPSIEINIKAQKLINAIHIED